MTIEKNKQHLVDKLKDYIVVGGLYRIEQGWDVHKTYVWEDSNTKSQGGTNLVKGSVVMVMRINTLGDSPAIILEVLHQHQLYKMLINCNYFIHKFDEEALEHLSTKEFIKLE